MGPTHCPLCMALAILCLLRASCHLGMVWQLRPAGEQTAAAGTPTWQITDPIA